MIWRVGPKQEEGLFGPKDTSQGPETQAIWKVQTTRKQLSDKDSEVKSASEKLQAAEVLLLSVRYVWGSFVLYQEMGIQ
jgi:hypothetical protein